MLFPRLISSEAKGFSVPEQCTIELDAKLVFPDFPEEILQRLMEFSVSLIQNGRLRYSPEISLKGRPTPFCSPYVVERSNPFVKVCAEALSSVTGKINLFYRNSVADECIYAKRLGVPALTIGPSGDNAHQANEYVDAASLRRIERAYMKILENLEELFK